MGYNNRPNAREASRRYMRMMTTRATISSIRDIESHEKRKNV